MIDLYVMDMATMLLAITSIFFTTTLYIIFIFHMMYLMKKILFWCGVDYSQVYQLPQQWNVIDVVLFLFVIICLLKIL